MPTVKAVRVIVRWRAGPAWTTGAPEDQDGWDEHAEFIDGLIDRGIFVMGGPYVDNSGSHTLLEGVSVEKARELVLQDPFVANGVFELEDVREWNVYVDELSGRD
jgi:uncharacterized protein YciI